MKKNIFLLLLAVLVLAACQPKPEAEPEAVDLDQVKSEVNASIDQFYDAWKAMDIEPLENMLADWGLYVGTDPKESWNKEEVVALWKDYFTDTTATTELTSISREINVSPCGLLAVAVCQDTYPGWSPNIPLRQTFYLVKMEDKWLIHFINWSFVARNEDVGVLNQTLMSEE
jgi:ketosteroid isomerase-like protein